VYCVYVGLAVRVRRRLAAGTRTQGGQLGIKVHRREAHFVSRLVGIVVVDIRVDRSRRGLLRRVEIQPPPSLVLLSLLLLLLLLLMLLLTLLSLGLGIETEVGGVVRRCAGHTRVGQSILRLLFPHPGGLGCSCSNSNRWQSLWPWLLLRLILLGSLSRGESRRCRL